MCVSLGFWIKGDILRHFCRASHGGQSSQALAHEQSAEGGGAVQFREGAAQPLSWVLGQFHWRAD